MPRTTEESSSTHPIAKTNHNTVSTQANQRFRDRQAGSVEAKPARNQHQAGASVSAAKKSGRQMHAVVAPTPNPVANVMVIASRFDSCECPDQQHENHDGNREPADNRRGFDGMGFRDVSIPPVYCGWLSG